MIFDRLGRKLCKFILMFLCSDYYLFDNMNNNQAIGF